MPTPAAQAKPENLEVERRDVLQRLLILSDLHPRYARHLEGAVKALKWEMKRTPQSDRDAVLKSMEQGCTTIEEILDETKFTSSEIQAVLNEFIEKGLIKRQKRPANRIRQAVWIYELCHAPAGR